MVGARPSARAGGRGTGDGDGADDGLPHHAALGREHRGRAGGVGWHVRGRRAREIQRGNRALGTKSLVTRLQ